MHKQKCYRWLNGTGHCSWHHWTASSLVTTKVHRRILCRALMHGVNFLSQSINEYQPVSIHITTWLLQKNLQLTTQNYITTVKHVNPLLIATCGTLLSHLTSLFTRTAPKPAVRRRAPKTAPRGAARGAGRLRHSAKTCSHRKKHKKIWFGSQNLKKTTSNKSWFDCWG